MGKPRLLIPLSIQFSVRYLLRTGLLEQIRDFAEPVIVPGWHDAELEKELQSLGFEVQYLPESRRGKLHQRTRSLINLLHQRRLNSTSEAIWERRADLHRAFGDRIHRRLRKRALQMATMLPGTADLLLKKEAEAFWHDTNAGDVAAKIDAMRIDAAFSLTPFLANEEAMLRVCAARRMPLCTSILSFDNITARGWIAVPFGRYLVWNKYNAGELRRAYPWIPNDGIEIVGSPQFDFYWNQQYRWDEAEWRRRLGLPPGRPVILFGGGHYFCAPHEPRFLLQLDEAIQRHDLPPEAVILFRRHPVDPVERWGPALRQCKNVVRDDPWKNNVELGHANIRNQDIQKLASCLLHSQVHVNVASTMTIDGAIFDRPQIGPAYDDSPGRAFDRSARELYLQEHYLPITRSGGLEVVRSRRALIEAVRSAFEDPGRLSAGRRRIVEEVCTFNDGRSTGRVAASLRNFFQAPAEPELHTMPLTEAGRPDLGARA